LVSEPAVNGDPAIDGESDPSVPIVNALTVFAIPPVKNDVPPMYRKLLTPEPPFNVIVFAAANGEDPISVSAPVFASIE
jgi:hypothetical protein